LHTRTIFSLKIQESLLSFFSEETTSDILPTSPHFGQVLATMVAFAIFAAKLLSFAMLFSLPILFCYLKVILYFVDN
jgi:hypothetical protein